MNRVIIIFISITFFGACSKNYDGSYQVPLLYKIDIQQGNVIEQNMLDRLKPGMSKNEVKYIMGTPVLIDPFHNNRWEYIFSLQKGSSVREQRRVTLYFDEDTEELTHIKGDIKAADGSRDLNMIVEADAVVVPKSDKEKKGFFRRLLDKVNPLESD
ncbi:MAG: cell envelope protein SmpA [Legionellales bacterium]|nr:cell envelope protein SmpA [Legionellales bacterium]|tara:strand:+ start:400 stop:870 length:471 start_codon:yes stop_codon:yes gene_type:complete